MSDVAKTLRDRRLNVWNEAKALAEDAAEQNRAFTAEEQGKWEALNEELDKLDERIKSVLDTQKRAKDADDAFDSVTSGRKTEPRRTTSSGMQQQGSTGDWQEEFRAFARGDQGAPRYYEIRHDPSRRPIEERTGGVLTTDTSQASASVPTDFYDRLVEHMIEVSGVLQTGPQVLRTSGGEALQIPRTTAHPSAVTASEAGDLPTGQPTLTMVTLGAYKYAVMIQLSRELIDDSGVDLVAYLSRACGRALGNIFGADLVTGTGSSQPKGFLADAATAVAGPSGEAAPTYSNLVDLQYSVIAPYRSSRSCHWIAADATIGGFRKILDTTNRPIWEPSMQVGAPDLLLGKPIVADPYMPAVAADVKAVAFGDFQNFFVRYVGPLRFERSDDYGFDKDLVTFRAILRGDAALVDSGGAVKSWVGSS